MTNRMPTVTNCTTVSGVRMSWRLLRETTASSIQALHSPNTTSPNTRTGGHTKKDAMRYGKGRILDIGCGGGRISLYFQRKGSDVLGIDVSPLAINVCKLKGLRKARVMSITEVSPRLGRFDTILMIGNNFGLFANPNRARRLLRQFYHSTTPNALIIAESNDPYRTSEPFHLAYHRCNRREGKMPGELTIRVRYKKYTTPWFDYLIVSKKEMKRILEGTGWRIKRFVDSKGSVYIGIIEKISNL